MHQWATFADLPVELSERIILLAARSCAFEKAWLAQLTRASRAIHTLVQPILANTIVITSSNLSRLRAASGAFTSTRCLMVDDDIEDHELLHAFLTSPPGIRSIDMFRGPVWVLAALLHVSRPSRVIITPAPWRGHGWSTSQADRAVRLSQMTHIRGAIFAVYGELRVPGPSPDPPLPTTHVFVDRFQGALTVAASVPEHLQSLLGTLIDILRLPRLQRLCVAVDHVQTEWASALSAFAHEHRETRLWINTVDSEYDPSTVFDDEHWLAGEQLYSDE